MLAFHIGNDGYFSLQAAPDFLIGTPTICTNPRNHPRTNTQIAGKLSSATANAAI